MLQKPAFFILIVALALQACSMPTPTPVLGEPPRVLILYVSTSGNDLNDCMSAASACQTVAGALGKSTPTSTINVGPGVFRWYAPLIPRHDITLQGAGRDQTILMSDSADVIQLTEPGAVVIRDLTVAGEDRSTYGNGIEVRADVQLILENCRIRDKRWGLRLFVGATATVRNCLMENNDYGIANGGDLTLAASTASGNLTALSNGGTALVEDTTIDGNGAFYPASGAARPAARNDAGVLTMNGGSVSNNGAWGVLIEGGNVTLTGVTISGNDGAGIWQPSGTTTVNSGLVQNNLGYGINIGGRSGVEPGLIIISQTAITGNTGAGLRIDGGEIRVQNTTISGNTAFSSGGGGIWGYDGNLFLLDSTVAYNTGTGITLYSGVGALKVTTRRSVVALNSGEECSFDGNVTLSASIFAAYVCNESWTPATLKLQPLAAEAGTFVHPIDADSPLANAGGPTGTCPAVDQRGYGRPAGATCDVGAYELGGLPIYSWRRS